MKAVKFEQGSKEWHLWRHRHLGSSDAPVIQGISPWRTKADLLREKTAAEPTITAPNWAQQRGLDDEPKARAYYELDQDMEMTPATFEHSKHTFLAASLDGYNEGAKRILEIKRPGKVDHAVAMGGKIPEKYIPQLVHQLIVTDAVAVDYLSYNPEGSKILTFNRDERLEAKLLQDEIEFWEMVQSKVIPEEAEEYLKLTDWKTERFFKKLGKAKAKAEEAAAEYARLQDEAKTIEEGKRIECMGIRRIEVISKGHVDYAKIPELKGVDLDRYRKKESKSVRFTYPK